jgi:hypothetical protein
MASKYLARYLYNLNEVIRKQTMIEISFNLSNMNDRVRQPNLRKAPLV